MPTSGVAAASVTSTVGAGADDDDAGDGAGTASAAGEAATAGAETAGEATLTSAAGAGFGAAAGAAVACCLAIVSLKHLEHMPPVEALPKKPQPLLHWVGAVLTSSWVLTSLPSAEAMIRDVKSECRAELRGRNERCEVVSTVAVTRAVAGPQQHGRSSGMPAQILSGGR